MLRVVAGTEQPDTLPWCAVAAAIPPGNRMAVGKPIPASYPILCGSRAKASLFNLRKMAETAQLRVLWQIAMCCLVLQWQTRVPA